MVCIDDFALKRREKYATVMVDIETGKVVDLLNSREYKDVKPWLERYPNIKVVSRDGSITYAKAIRDAHPTAIQISDRFHLLKNLTDYCKDYIKRTITHNIEIGVDVLKVLDVKDILEIKKKYQFQTKWDLILAVKGMRTDGYTINQVCEVLEIGNKSVIKYSTIENSEKGKYDNKPLLELKQENNRKRKENLISEVKLLKENGHSIRYISRELNLQRSTIRKYLNSDGVFIHASLGRKYKSKLDNYYSNIFALLKEGLSSMEILKRLENNGFNGSESLVRHFISKINRQNISDKNQIIEKVERKNLVSLLYKDIEKVKFITKEQLSKVTEKYPELKLIYKVVQEFKAVLFSKEISNLNKWIETSKSLNIMELNSFVSGIERDLEAVKNSVMYSYSNGLAEGTVNKIKVIKRIMYGRCGFELLRRKVLLSSKFN